MLPRVRRAGGLPIDLSVLRRFDEREYGEKKEGADFAYNNTVAVYSQSSCTNDRWRRPVTCSDMDLREDADFGTPAYGSKDVLPGMIKRVRRVTLSGGADASPTVASYDQKLACQTHARSQGTPSSSTRGSRSTANVMKAVDMRSRQAAWNPFQANELMQRGAQRAPAQADRENREAEDPP